MELGLSLGDTTPSKASDRFIPTAAAATVTATTTTVGVNKSLGFCMALGVNPLDAQDNHDHDDGDGDEYEDDDDEEHDEHKENGGLKDVTLGSQKTGSMNPPVQLDLLPSAPVLRHHTSFPWSSDNGSSEGGSSGNAAAGRGFEVKRMAVGTEEATSSCRLEFMSYGGRNGSENHKRGFEIGNDAVVVERASSRASDEDEHGLSRKKLRLSKEQSAYLEETFKEHNTLNPKQKLALAEQLHLRPRQVEVWFQNRRARTKLKQTEVDFEYLKRCCETLTDENRRLHKELQELRALKTTSNPFYMQLPATTLTMCPSCERVATSVPPPSSATLTNPVEQNSMKASTPLNPKPRPLMFPPS
ncbi:putative transcription factor HB-HD-ZIP family [Helianthus annuus]|uniref:Putative leucine zipper, homeobox-associated, Homeodomain-like protein n=1 Tax=Helianthus annuus TaxID=4232 RepID=A0A251VPA8_HELAN|nr:homeobox-leucine zipper protein HOX11 isoform X1 [Helianthus annuus]KAF5822486.1 putative transcription factor HB-HD-ZIP family [Helianthus annuus]KAJ0611949.1 putative transcription factor homeobox-WOX family [Helianthus annuus]KAJ0627319.1 putative transcription factor homeobox-WOX family [Helianthus annuus]